MKVVDSSALACCPNCGTQIIGKYCPGCGQRNDQLRLSLQRLVREFFEAFFKVDRKLLATLKSLLIPGKLTVEFFAGHRARYPRPLTLYFICAGIYFLAWSRAPHEPASHGFQIGMADFHVAIDSEPDANVDDAPPTIWSRARRHPERVDVFARELQSPRGQFVQVIALGLAFSITARKRKLMLSEHLVFALHLQSAAALMLSGALLFDVREGHLLPIVAYNTWAFGRVYEFGLWGTLWRSVASLVLAIVIAVLAALPAFFAYLLW